MAKKRSKAEKEPRHVPINWKPEGMPVVFANQMLVNAGDHEVHLHFFEVSPPLIFGTDEQKKEQIESLTSVDARGVVRVVVSKERLPAIIEALQSTAERIADRKAQSSNGRDSKKQ
jgi:hypothetical protein